VLLVDDSEFVRRAYGDRLSERGFKVDTAASAAEGLEQVSSRTYDVILSDISMPGMNGIELLKAVRQFDLDVPVLLMTGGPTLETAAQAVEYGAYRYLSKPLRLEVLEDALRRAGRYHTLALLKRNALEAAGGAAEWPGDRAALEGRFQSAMNKLWIAFQPIVSPREREVHAYEVLVRSDEPSLRRPSDLLEAAERLGLLPQLGRKIRTLAAEAVSGLPFDVPLFLNLHPNDLNDLELAHNDPLARVADRVVLEITERAPLDGVRSLARRLEELRKCGFRLAVDDLGAGYAGLSSMAHIEPEYVKLDMSLIRGIDSAPTKQKLVRSMAQLCTELGMSVIAEGVETDAERKVLESAGCALLQGFLFARPERDPPKVRWE
jgi:EAL domain-containing protein (putative c-di-GMP-specific phosphodiesterase class I)